MATKDHKDPDALEEKPKPADPSTDDGALFSLEALKRAQESSKIREAKERDDSGMIDLRALESIERDADPREGMADVAMVSPGGLFDLTAPPGLAPSAPPPAVVDPVPVKPSRSKAAVAIGSIVAVAAIVGAFVAMRDGGAPPPAPAAVTTTAPAPSPPPVADEPGPEAAIAAVTPGQPAAKPSAPTPVAAPAKAAARRNKPAQTAAPAAPRKPAGPPCDLTCQMKRAVSNTK